VSLKKTILIVDDQAQVRELLKATLEVEYEVIEAATGLEAMAAAHLEVEYEVIGAATGLEAMAAAQKVEPDLIILDLYLGNSLITGLQTVKGLKSSLAHIPILLISGVVKADNADVQQALDMGADKFLEKPFSPLHLLEVIEQLLNGG
jgi:two-component system, OmpR family, phosphate regulon response regulator PhoB